MTTVYLLTKGEYSDYRVIGVFTSYENALVRAITSDRRAGTSETMLPIDYEIDELTLDVPIPPHTQGYRLWHVEMFADGAISWTTVRDPIFHKPEMSIIARYPAPKTITLTLAINVWAKDEQHAVKIANEKRIGLLSTNQFKPTDAPAGSTN